MVERTDWSPVFFDLLHDSEQPDCSIRKGENMVNWGMIYYCFSKKALIWLVVWLP